MFTQKHYRHIAQFIKDEQYRAASDGEVDYLYDCMVRLFSNDNPKFKEHLFNSASGRNDYT